MAAGRKPAELMRAIGREGDRDAFAQLFDQYAPRVKAYMLRLGCDNTTAEESAQEVMLNVWRHAASFDPAKASVATWIFTIARNHRIDLLRRDQRTAINLRDPALAAPEAPGVEADLHAGEREARIARAVAGLPPEQSKIIDLSYKQGKSHREIAEALGLPLGTVKSRLRLALMKLREALAENS